MGKSVSLSYAIEPFAFNSAKDLILVGIGKPLDESACLGDYMGTEGNGTIHVSCRNPWWLLCGVLQHPRHYLCFDDEFILYLRFEFGRGPCTLAVALCFAPLLLVIENGQELRAWRCGDCHERTLFVRTASIVVAYG